MYSGASSSRNFVFSILLCLLLCIISSQVLHYRLHICTTRVRVLVSSFYNVLVEYSENIVQSTLLVQYSNFSQSGAPSTSCTDMLLHLMADDKCLFRYYFTLQTVGICHSV